MEGRRRGKRRGDFIDGYDEMPGWNEVTVFSDFCLPVQCRVPQLVYSNKTGNCLSVCLFICLSICSAMGGQTARPSRLKFGG